MRSPLPLLLLPLTLLAGEPEPVLRTEIMLFPITPRSCYCGVRGAVLFRNPTDQDAKVAAKLDLPYAWLSDPSTMSLTVPARSVLMLDLRAWSLDLHFPRTGALTIGVSGTADIGPLQPAAAKPFPLRDVRCMAGEPLCH